jgi:hypothetical protein
MKAAILLLLLLITVAAFLLTWNDHAWQITLGGRPYMMTEYHLLGAIAVVDVLILSYLGKSDEVAE